MPRKKRIGIVGWNVGDTTFGVKKSYLEFIKQFGKPVILAPGCDEMEDLDLLLLPGGADVNPARYKQWPSFHTGNPNQMLEAFDAIMLPQYIEANIPIVGICRGMQSLYVHFGGALTQHIYGHPSSDNDWETVHEIYAYPEFKDRFINENGEPLLNLSVNSRHHQVCDPEKKPEDIDILGCYAFMDSKKTKRYVSDHPEIIQHKTKNIFAVQWHPEDCPNDKLTPYMIRKFLNKK